MFSVLKSGTGYTVEYRTIIQLTRLRRVREAVSDPHPVSDIVCWRWLQRLSSDAFVLTRDWEEGARVLVDRS